MTPQSTVTRPTTGFSLYLPTTPYGYLVTALAFALSLSLPMLSGAEHRLRYSLQIHVVSSKFTKTRLALREVGEFVQGMGGGTHSGRGCAQLAGGFRVVSIRGATRAGGWVLRRGRRFPHLIWQGAEHPWSAILSEKQFRTDKKGEPTPQMRYFAWAK